MTLRVQRLWKASMPLTDKETETLTHLGYEWWMTRSTYSFLIDMVYVNDPVRNALIESMNIHIRASVAFFCYKPRENDWSVCHLNHDLQLTKRPDYLCDLMDDINKRIAHLTARRAKDAGLVHEWRVDPALNFIDERIAEVRAALGADFPSGWGGDAPATTHFLREIGSQTVTGSSAPFTGGSIGATGPAPPGF